MTQSKWVDSGCGVRDFVVVEFSLATPNGAAVGARGALGAGPIGTDTRCSRHYLAWQDNVFARSATDFLASATLSQGQVQFMAGAALQVQIFWRSRMFARPGW